MTTQKPPRNATPNPDSSNVQPLNPAPARVQPHAEWRLEGVFGHMAFEAGEGGRLVRLADVLRWLQASREIPRRDALNLLCEAMPAEVMGGLYWLQPAAFATPVPATHTFGFPTAEQIEKRKATDRQNALQAGLERERQHGRFDGGWHLQNGRISAGYPEPTEPGLPALLKYLRGYWVPNKRNPDPAYDVLDDPRVRYATTLAIRLDKAHALWGYGHRVGALQLPDVVSAAPATWAELLIFRKMHPGAPWSASQKGILKKEKSRRVALPGATGVAKAMAAELGITVTLVNNHIRAANTPGKREVARSKAA